MRAPLRFLAVFVCGPLLLAACDRGTSPTTTGTPASQPPAAGSPAASGSPVPQAAPPVVYKLVDDFCLTLALDRLDAVTQLWNQVRSPTPKKHAAGSTAILSCTGTLAGGSAPKVTFHVTADVSSSGVPMAYQFEGLRREQERQGHKTADVPGVGTAAYTYTNDLGPHVEAYAGNAYIAASMKPYDSAAKLPTDVVDRLAAICKAAFEKLPTQPS